MANTNFVGEPVRSKLFYLGLPWLACLAACTVINLFYFPPTTIFPDEQRFLWSAVRLAASGEFWAGPDRAGEMPGTAIFFGAAVWLFGPDGAILPIRFAQSVLLIVQSALLAFIARRLFAKDIALYFASGIAALYPFFLFYQGLLLSETLFDTLLCAGIAALYWWRDRGLRLDLAFLVACLFLTAATLTKATLTILPPILIAATAWSTGIHLRRAVAILAAASCLFCGFMSPWWIRNATLFGTFVPFTTGSAQNLYIGNNPRNLNAGINWKTDIEPEVTAKLFALPSEIERQHAFTKAAVDYIKENPTAFFRAAGLKFIRFWSLVPNASEYKTSVYSIISAASFGPILALALICAIRFWRQWYLFTPLYLLITYFTLIHVIAIASLRYRLPIEPAIIVLAAGSIAAFLDRNKNRGDPPPSRSSKS